ncbi:MAG: hypothetical protein ACLUMK_13480 [Christensenellales bacterium]
MYKPKDEDWHRFERTSVSIAEGADATPYQVGSFNFIDCGLYIIVGVRTEAQAERMDRLISALGMSGIGGKISSGYGSLRWKNDRRCAPFDAQTKWLHDALEKPDANISCY